MTLKSMILKSMILNSHFISFVNFEELIDLNDGFDFLVQSHFCMLDV